MESTTRRLPGRVSLGGVSLLLVVAFALQASAGMIEHRQLTGGRADQSTRQIAEAQSRPKFERRQQERPAVRKAGPIVEAPRRGPAALPPATTAAPRVRMQPLGETDLPPPSDR